MSTNIDGDLETDTLEPEQIKEQNRRKKAAPMFVKSDNDSRMIYVAGFTPPLEDQPDAVSLALELQNLSQEKLQAELRKEWQLQAGENWEKKIEYIMKSFDMHRAYIGEREELISKQKQAIQDRELDKVTFVKKTFEQIDGYTPVKAVYTSQSKTLWGHDRGERILYSALGGAGGSSLNETRVVNLHKDYPVCMAMAPYNNCVYALSIKSGSVVAPPTPALVRQGDAVRVDTRAPVTKEPDGKISPFTPPPRAPSTGTIALSRFTVLSRIVAGRARASKINIRKNGQDVACTATPLLSQAALLGDEGMGIKDGARDPECAGEPYSTYEFEFPNLITDMCVFNGVVVFAAGEKGTFTIDNDKVVLFNSTPATRVASRSNTGVVYVVSPGGVSRLIGSSDSSMVIEGSYDDIYVSNDTGIISLIGAEGLIEVYDTFVMDGGLKSGGLGTSICPQDPYDKKYKTLLFGVWTAVTLIIVLCVATLLYFSYRKRQ